jgi:hypothetical protein
MAVGFHLDSAGRRVCDDKEETKKKIKHSPDSADSLNLAFFENVLFEPGAIIPARDRALVMTDTWDKKRKKKRRLFGD